MQSLELVKGKFICPNCKSRDLYVKIEYKPDSNNALAYQECFECGHKCCVGPRFEAECRTIMYPNMDYPYTYPFNYKITWDIPFNIPEDFSLMDYYKNERLKAKVKE